jgi:hypothetical protein
LLTPDIVTQVQINLNRTDTNIVGSGKTITSQIQLWCNRAKRKIESDFPMDYMIKSVVTNIANPTQTIPISSLCDVHYFKDMITVMFRQKAPSEDLSWTDVPKISWREKLEIEAYVSPGTVYTGPPEGWLMDGTNLIITPIPDATSTYDINTYFWVFSTDWTFVSNEEPYIAMYGFEPVISWATKLGFDWLGEQKDSQYWEMKYMKDLKALRMDEARRSMSSEYHFLPLTGAEDHKIARRIGDRWPLQGFGRI